MVEKKDIDLYPYFGGSCNSQFVVSDQSRQHTTLLIFHRFWQYSLFGLTIDQSRDFEVSAKWPNKPRPEEVGLLPMHGIQQTEPFVPVCHCLHRVCCWRGAR